MGLFQILKLIFGLFGQALGESTLKTYKSLSRLKVLKDFFGHPWTAKNIKKCKNMVNYEDFES